MRTLALLCLASTLAFAQRGGGAEAGLVKRRPDRTPGGVTQAKTKARDGEGRAQGTPAVTLPPGSLEGRVMSTTGEPLRKVVLTLRPNGRGGGGGTYGATSAADGSFRFASVDQGNYALIGERTGYVRETLSSPGGQTRVLEVVSEKTTSGIELKLTPQSVIAGHVFDEDGDPVQSVDVEVWRYAYPRGRKQLTQVESGSTNDLGEFRIYNLSPGRYYVSATARTQRNPRAAGTGTRGTGWAWWARRPRPGLAADAVNRVGNHRRLRHHLFPEPDGTDGRIAARSGRRERGARHRYPFAEGPLSPRLGIDGRAPGSASGRGCSPGERQREGQGGE